MVNAADEGGERGRREIRFASTVDRCERFTEAARGQQRPPLVARLGGPYTVLGPVRARAFGDPRTAAPRFASPTYRLEGLVLP